MSAWILSLMLVLQPQAPWRATYEATAAAIAATVQREEPLFAGEQGRERTAALLVSLAWFESRFDAHALGDHGRSHGLYQIQEHGELADPADATRAALGMLRESFRVCRARPLEERLGWYAAGGPDCSRGLRESRHRVARAMWLFRTHPPIAVDSLAMGGKVRPSD